MKKIEKKQSWQLALSSIVLSLMFAVIIISGYELFIAQSIVIFSFFILSKRIKLKMYLAAIVAALILFILINPAMIIWVIPSLLIPLLWVNRKPGLIHLTAFIASLIMYSIVYIVVYTTNNKLILDISTSLITLLVIGESISATIICYLGDIINDRYK